MARTPRTRNQRKYVTAARAQKRLEQALERIDFEEDVIIPNLEKLAKLEAKGEVNLDLKMKPLEIEGPK